jgi:predicted ribosome quality control (RQC) complex YloA/Tae2 family protein
MGKDKYENEDLIKYGLPIDVWFHVDNISSAHVYLRLPEDVSINEIPKDALNECLQLVKENSIEGCKKDRVSIVYTPWQNLLKRPSAEIGEVGFKKQNEVITVHNISEDRQVLKRINKTKEVKEVNFETEKEAYLKEMANKKKKFFDETVN